MRPPNSRPNAAQASGLGSVAATRRTRGSPRNVGTMIVNARPRPATPIRSGGLVGAGSRKSITAGSPVDHDLVIECTRDAHHDVAGALVLGQHQVAMVDCA